MSSAPWLVYPKKKPVKAAPSKSYSGGWRDVDWKELYIRCKEEQEVAIRTAEEENLSRYKEFLAAKALEKEALNPEAGSWEGNLSDEFPFRTLPESTLAKIRRTASNNLISDFIEEKMLGQFAIEFMPDIFKHISSYKLTNLAGEDYDPKLANEQNGKIDVVRFYKSVFTDETMLGLYNFLMLDSRSAFIEKQYTSPGRNYCALVPLIMAAYKHTKSIPYSHWNREHIRGITSSKLADAMLYQPETPFTKEDIMEAREEGLLIKSGKDKGKMRNPVYTFKLYGATKFKEVPELAQVMLSQIWCAHPNNRIRTMVLDYNNWDNIPAALISSETLRPTSDFTYTEEKSTGLPWA